MFKNYIIHLSILALFSTAFVIDLVLMHVFLMLQESTKVAGSSYSGKIGEHMINSSLCVFLLLSCLAESILSVHGDL